MRRTVEVLVTLKPGLAGRLVQEGRDVWVLDLQSSAGMLGRADAWSFEEIGCEDIPLAVDHVVRICGEPIDVVAHCMGSAMLCMSLLADIPPRRFAVTYTGTCAKPCSTASAASCCRRWARS